jgi:hypothetical protein
MDSFLSRPEKKNFILKMLGKLSDVRNFRLVLHDKQACSSIIIISETSRNQSSDEFFCSKNLP